MLRKKNTNILRKRVFAKTVFTAFILWGIQVVALTLKSHSLVFIHQCRFMYLYKVTIECRITSIFTVPAPLTNTKNIQKFRFFSLKLTHEKGIQTVFSLNPQEAVTERYLFFSAKILLLYTVIVIPVSLPLYEVKLVQRVDHMFSSASLCFKTQG